MRDELIPSPDRTPKPLKTDQDGKLSISMLPGDYDMVVTSPGFRNSTQRLKVNSSANQTVNVALTIALDSPPVMVEPSPPDQSQSQQVLGERISDSRLSGTVVDSEGAAIGDALVIIHWDESGRRAELDDNTQIKDDIRTRTNKEGHINLDLAPGFYDVFVASTAFSPACLKVRVNAGNPATFKVKLKADPLVCKERCDTFHGVGAPHIAVFDL